MKYYAILFKYAGKWHRDVILRQQEDNAPNDNIRMWLIESTKFAIERLRLRKENENTIFEAQAFEIVAEEKKDGSGQVGLIPAPIDAVQEIQL